MTDTIRNIAELLEAPHEVVQHYLSQVTVEEDLHLYLKWLYDNEVTTSVTALLKREKNRPLGIHPSSASKKGVCLLKLYYECTGKVAPGGEGYKEESNLTWDLGTILHETFQTWFAAMYGDQFAKEVNLRSKKGYLRGHADGVFTFKNYRFVLEMKSIKEGGNYGWEKVQAKPQEDHVRQVHFYMHMADIPFGLILYINKNAGLFKEHAVSFNKLLWDEIVSTVLMPVINGAYKKGPEPPATVKWHCRWCPFQNSCPAKKKEHGYIEE